MNPFKYAILCALLPISALALERPSPNDGADESESQRWPRLVDQEKSDKSSPVGSLRGLSIANAKLSDQEMHSFDKIKRMPRVKNLKLLDLGQKPFIQGGLQVEFFENELVEFRTAKMEGASTWEGKRNGSSDRFVIRSISGLYSGHFLYLGKLFVLTPLRAGVSAFYEIDNRYDCGTGMTEGKSESHGAM